MSRLFFSPIKVYVDSKGKPVRIEFKHSRLTVKEILECWYDTGCWWEGESEKVFYRISCSDATVREIFQEVLSGEWFLYKVYD